MRKPSIGRRRFLKQAAATGAAVVSAGATGSVPAAAAQQQSSLAPSGATNLPALPPETDPVPSVEVLTTDRPGGDFMVDVLKTLNLEYVAANPGSSFRGLHESLINHGGNSTPEFITCCHEESSIAMCHGYYKVEGKPMAALVHGTVGLQHAAMAIYNAYCDRVPVYIIAGNSIDVTQRRPGVEWDHSVQDAATIVRDFTKWDDLPISLQHFAESAVRAYKIAMTPPMMPVLLVADTELQDNAIPRDAKLRIPKTSIATPPAGDSGAVAEAAKMLAAAENPVIVAGRAARSAEGLRLMVELAETLQCGVIDTYQRLNFPSHHRLNLSFNPRAALANCDLVLALEPGDLYGTLRPIRQQRQLKLITITAADVYIKSNYQDFQRFNESDLAIAGDAEATLPSLIEALNRQSGGNRAFQARGEKIAEANQRAMEQARQLATYGWDASPDTTARLP